MALADLLTADGDVQTVKNSLTATYHVLVQAANDYAKASLEASNRALEVAMTGGPCAEAYTSYTEVSKFDRLARHAVESLTDVANILRSINESDDEHANNAYADHLIEMSRINETSALLEGAGQRLGMVTRALPEDPQPAARFNAAVFGAQSGAQGA